MVTALAVSVASFMLNATMFSPAIRDINAHLGPQGYASMSAYFYLSGAICNVVLIRWSDYLGRKNVLLGILVVQCLGTLLCIVGTSLPIVVVGRILQGGSNITFGLSLPGHAWNPSAQRRSVSAGVLSAVNAGVGGFDALLGGFMVDHYGYRSIFLLTLVVGVIAMALGAKAVPAGQPGGAVSGRMDWMGAALIALGIAGINLYLGNGGRQGWLSPLVLGFIAAAAVALVAFVVVERRVEHPLVHIDQMRSRYAWPVIALTILFLASFMVVLGYIIPSIAEDDHIGFGASGQTTALLFITPASAVPTGRGAFYRTTRGDDRLRNCVAGGTGLRHSRHLAPRGLCVRPAHGHPAHGRIRDSPGYLPYPDRCAGCPTGTQGRARIAARDSQHQPSVSAGQSDSPGPERLSRRVPRRGSSPHCGSVLPSASPPWRRASSSSPGRLSRQTQSRSWHTEKRAQVKSGAGNFTQIGQLKPHHRAVTSPADEVRSRWILAAVSTALFCVQIDYFAMNLSLPRMAADLHSTTSDLQWVISVYMLTLGAFMVPAGRIGDIFGRRRALLAGSHCSESHRCSAQSRRLPPSSSHSGRYKVWAPLYLSGVG